jgi:hypothetical protein
MYFFVLTPYSAVIHSSDSDISDSDLQSLPDRRNLPRFDFGVAQFWRPLYTKWPLPVSVWWKIRTSAYK